MEGKNKKKQSQEIEKCYRVRNRISKLKKGKSIWEFEKGQIITIIQKIINKITFQ